MQRQIPAEAYVNGVSTRKVERLARSLGIEGLSKSKGSEMVQSPERDEAR